MPRRAALPLALVLVAAPADPPALAQVPEVTALPELTVTATRADRATRDVPATIQVIRREEIERQLALSPSPADAVARLVPGYAAIGTQTVSSASETFRGRETLVLLDGVPLNTPLRDVSRILGVLDLSTVERIEVVSGASSLYGAGATGGTINLITRRGAAGGPVFSIDTALRAFTANPGRSLAPRTSLGVSGRTEGGFDYLLQGSAALSRLTYDGAGREMPSDSLLGQGGADRATRTNLFARFGYDLDAERRVEFSATSLRFDQSPDHETIIGAPRARPDFATPYEGLSIAEDTQSFSARYSDAGFALGRLSILGYHNEVEKRFTFTRFSFPANSFVYYSGDPANPTGRDNQSVLHSTRSGLNVTVDTDLSGLAEGWRLTWGGDLVRDRTRQELTSGRPVFTPLEQTTYAAFAQLQVPVGDRVTLRGGLRYERFDLDVEDFTRPSTYFAQAAGGGVTTGVLPDLPVRGGAFTYDQLTFNLGGTLRLTPTAELYGGFSQGFALPDVGAFTRRAGQSLAFACPVANPGCLPAGTSVSYADIGLEAAVVNNWEAGLRRRGPGWRGSVVGFLSTTDGGVTYDPTANVISQQKEQIWGAEAEGEVDITDTLSVGGLVAWREGRYDSNRDGRIDSALPNNRIASPLRGALRATWRLEDGTRLRVEAEGFSGRNERTSTAGARFKIPAGATMNVAAETPLAGGTLYAAVENLFDAAYWNPTATSVRNVPVEAFGRTVTVGYRRTF
jgi:iron complex outermembrane receptor protein